MTSRLARYWGFPLPNFVLGVWAIAYEKVLIFINKEHLISARKGVETRRRTMLRNVGLSISSPVEFTLWMLGHFCFLSYADFFSKLTFQKFIQEYDQSVKQFGSRSGPTICRAWSGSKLFAKMISRRHCQVKRKTEGTFPMIQLI